MKLVATPEDDKTAIEEDPRKVGEGDVVTIIAKGKEMRIYITDKSYSLANLNSPEKEQLKELLESMGISSVSPINPPPKSDKMRKVQAPDTLAKQLEGKPVGAVKLATGMEVQIIKIEKVGN